MYCVRALRHISMKHLGLNIQAHTQVLGMDTSLATLGNRTGEIASHQGGRHTVNPTRRPRTRTMERMQIPQELAEKQ